MRKENRFPGETFPGLGGWQTSVKTSLTTGPAAVLHARMKLKLKRKLRCSFCGRDESAVAKLLGGPRAYICDACIGVCNRILDATPEASGDWDSMTDKDLLASLKSAEASVDAVRSLLQTRIEVLRKRGVSWSDIGGALNISRQAAWERFS